MQNSKLNSTQESYIENISNPKNVSDLLLALQNPVSPAYKKLMNQILLNEEIHLITDLLIERFLYQEYKATQHEKDLIFREWLVKHALAEEKLKRIFVPQVLVDREGLHELDKKSFSSRLDDRAMFIRQLEQQHELLQQRLVSLKHEGEANSQAWRVLQDKRTDDYINVLKDKKINFITADGDALNADGFKVKQIIKQAFESPAPLAVLEKVGASWQAYSEISPSEPHQPEGGNIPPPPPLPTLPPGFSNPSLMAGKNNVMQEIRLLACLCDHKDDPKELMKVLKKPENKQACILLAGANLSLRPSSGKKVCLGKTEEAQIFGEAINLYQESSAVKNACNQLDVQLAHEKQLMKEETKIYKLEMGEGNDNGRPQGPKPRH